MIPNSIHQIFINDGLYNVDLDDETIDNTKSWKQFHPNYEHRLWNLHQIRMLAQKFDSSVLSAIDVCAFPAMKTDIASLMILFLQGGIYTALNIKCIRNFFDEFRNYKLVLVEHFRMDPHVEKKLSNGFIMVQPRHEFIRRALTDCLRNVEARLDVGIWFTTGPKVLMRLQNKFLPENYGQFENGVGVIREGEVYGKLFIRHGGGYNKPGRHWHDREKLESIYTDCDVRARSGKK